MWTQKPWVKDSLVLLGVFMPVIMVVATEIYNWSKRPDFHFIFDSSYKKNPAIEWDRQIDKMFGEFGKLRLAEAFASPKTEADFKQLMRGIAALSEKPLDSKSVRVANVSGYDLRNIRVHFTGCTGFDSYQTWPDAQGSPQNRGLQGQGASSVTVRYDAIARALEREPRYATITFYGTDASQCKPTVEAELANGEAAIGREINIDEFNTNKQWEAYYSRRFSDIAFNLFFAFAIIYLYFEIRSLKKRAGR